MYIALTLFGLLFIGTIIQVYFEVPVVDRTFAFVERICSGSYWRFFGWPILFAVGLYAVPLLLAAPLFGMRAVLTDVSSACCLGFLGGIFMCFCSFLSDVGSLATSLVTGSKRRGTADIRLIFSVLFITCVYGSVGALFFSPTSKWFVL